MAPCCDKCPREAYIKEMSICKPCLMEFAAELHTRNTGAAINAAACRPQNLTAGTSIEPAAVARAAGLASEARYYADMLAKLTTAEPYAGPMEPVIQTLADTAEEAAKMAEKVAREISPEGMATLGAAAGGN